MRLDTAHLRGGSVSYFVDDMAPAAASALLFHHGTPSAGPRAPWALELARAAGIRVVQLIRPGYGTAVEWQGYTLADIGRASVELMRHLGIATFGVAGYSGGGPYALATAIASGDACRGLAVVAGMVRMEDPDALRAMGYGDSEVNEVNAYVAAVREGREEVLRIASAEADGLAAIDDPALDRMVASAPDADRPYLNDENVRRLTVEGFRWTLAAGAGGFADDLVALFSPWDLEIEDIACPTWLHYGSEDPTVRVADGHWIRERVPHASLTVHKGFGHTGAMWQAWPRVIADMAAVLPPATPDLV